MRMTPPHLHSTALSSFDDKVRDAFSHIAVTMPSDEQWKQATCCISLAGFGLRKASQHAPAAFLASTCASRERCHSLDVEFRLEADDPSSSVGQALTLHNNTLPADDQVTPETLPGAKQKILSAALDKATFKRRHAAECPANQASLLSESGKGAREFRQAVPH